MLSWIGKAAYAGPYINEQFRATTHTYVALSDGWRCTVCRTFTSRALLECWLSTPCPGEVQTNAGVMSGRRLVHYAHNLRQTKGDYGVSHVASTLYTGVTSLPISAGVLA